MYTCEEWSPIEQSCMMSMSLLTNQSEVSRKLSETIQHLDESLSSVLNSPELNLTEVVGIKEQLSKLMEMLMSQELFEGINPQEVFTLDPKPQGSLLCDELKIKNEYMTDIEKLQLLDSISEDFFQYSQNIYSSPSDGFSNILIHSDLEKISADTSCNSTSESKNCIETEFSYCDESINMSMFTEHVDGVGGGFSLADELQIADTNCTLVENKNLDSSIKKEGYELVIKDNIDPDFNVKQETCNVCHCSEKEKILKNLEKEIILEKEISDNLRAEMKILQTREKELENDLNIKNGKQKDLENELNLIKKKENDITEEFHKRETDLKNMEFEMKEIKEQHNCKVSEMRLKENELLEEIEKLKEKGGVLKSEVNELREKEEEVESMIFDLLDKEKLLEEKENNLKKLEDELLQNSDTISNLKSQVSDYESELKILRSRKLNLANAEECEECSSSLVCLDTDSDNRVELELNRSAEDILEKENLLEEKEIKLKEEIEKLEDKLLERSNIIKNLEFEVHDYKKELEMFKAQKSSDFSNNEEKEVGNSVESDIHRLTDELLEKENLLEEKEKEFIKKINSHQDEIQEKCQMINNLDSELMDCKKELEMLRSEKSGIETTEEKDNHTSSIAELPSNNLEICKLTKEKKDLEKELEVFQEIMSFLELEADTREVELNNTKKELKMTTSKLKDLTSLHNSLSEKLKQTEIFVASLKEEILNLKQVKPENSKDYCVNIDKKGNESLTKFGDAVQSNKAKTHETNLVDELKSNEVRCDKAKLTESSVDNLNVKSMENIVVASLTENSVKIFENKKINSFADENYMKSSEDLEKELSQLALLLTAKEKEIEELKLELRGMKEKSKEDFDSINSFERKKLLDEIKQKDEICNELHYNLQNLKELLSKLESENTNNRETVEKINALLQCFNLNDIEGIEKVLKEALSLSNNLKLDPISMESENVENTETSCLHSSEHTSHNFDITVEQTSKVCESSNLSVNESVSAEHEGLKKSSSVERFEDSSTFAVSDIENLKKTLTNIKELSEELAVKNKECDALKHDIDILLRDQATLVETLQERQIALEDYEKVIREKDGSIKILENNYDDLKRAHEECAEKGMEDALEIEKYVNIIEKYDLEMTEKDEKAQKILKENKILTIDISDLNLKLENCQESEAIFRDENGHLKKELKDMKELSIEYNNMKDNKHLSLNANKQIDELNGKLNSLQSENTSLNSEVENLKNQLNEEKIKCKSLDEELDNLDKYYRDIIEASNLTVKQLKEKNKSMNESLMSCKKVHVTNYENVSMDTDDPKNISNTNEICNLKSENKTLGNLVSELQEENELLKLQESKKMQRQQNENDSNDGDDASLREQVFNLQKDKNLLKIQLQAMQAPIKNEAQKYKDELKLEQEKNKKLMSDMRRVLNENCDSTIIDNNSSSAEGKVSSHGSELQACGFGSGVVLDVQVMNTNYYLEKENEKMQQQMTSLKEQVEWYKRKGSKWKTKCYKEERKAQELAQKLGTGNKKNNIYNVDSTPAAADKEEINLKEDQTILKPSPKLRLDDEMKNKNNVESTPVEHKQINMKQKICHPEYGYKSYNSSSKKISKIPEENVVKKVPLESCVLQEDSSQNTPLQSVEVSRHTKDLPTSSSAFGKENKKRVEESKDSEDCKVQ